MNVVLNGCEAVAPTSKCQTAWQPIKTSYSSTLIKYTACALLHELAKHLPVVDTSDQLMKTRSTTVSRLPPWWRHQMETLRYWPFLRGIHSSLVDFPQKSQWRRALMLSLICAWTNGWENNRNAGDLIRHRAHYDVIAIFLTTVCVSVMWCCKNNPNIFLSVILLRMAPLCCTISGNCMMSYDNPSFGCNIPNGIPYAP